MRRASLTPRLMTPAPRLSARQTPRLAEPGPAEPGRPLHQPERRPTCLLACQPPPREPTPTAAQARTPGPSAATPPSRLPTAVVTRQRPAPRATLTRVRRTRHVTLRTQAQRPRALPLPSPPPMPCVHSAAGSIQRSASRTSSHAALSIPLPVHAPTARRLASHIHSRCAAECERGNPPSLTVSCLCSHRLRAADDQPRAPPASAVHGSATAILARLVNFLLHPPAEAPPFPERAPQPERICESGSPFSSTPSRASFTRLSS